jgi:hypothetical protein
LVILVHGKKSDIYSVSCDLSAAPAPGQSSGSGTRPANDTTLSDRLMDNPKKITALHLENFYF